MIEETKTKIEEFKELVNTLPTNNIANRRKNIDGTYTGVEYYSRSK